MTSCRESCVIWFFPSSNPRLMFGVRPNPWNKSWRLAYGVRIKFCVSVQQRQLLGIAGQFRLAPRPWRSAAGRGPLMGDDISCFPSIPERTSAKVRLTALQKAEFIRGLDIFSEATVEELYRLASIAKELDFAPRQILFREDDMSDAFYILVQGKVELPSEKRHMKAVLGPGEAVGLYSALTREPRSATAQALEDTFTVVI